MNTISDADAAIEADEIGAATEKHMLAVINHLAQTGMQVRRGTPAEIASPLRKLHVETSLRQRAGSSHSGHATAHDRHQLFRFLHRSARFNRHLRPLTTRAIPMRARPTTSIQTFCAIGTLARSENTS